MVAARNRKPTKKVCISENCEKQGKEQVLGNFYSSSLTEIFCDGKIPICKTCCLKLFEIKGFEGFQQIMKLINKPIYDELFKGDYGDYIRQVASLPQYKLNTYEDSTLFEEKKTISSLNKTKAIELSQEELKESEDFWGSGRTEEEYIWLNTEFIDYTNRYKTDNSKTMEDYIAEICLTRLDIRNKRNEGKDVDKQVKMLNDLMTAAGIKPVQENSSASAEQDVFGLWIKKLENERPVSDPSPEWADVDGIRKYIQTFLLHPLLRLFGKEKDNPFLEETSKELEKYTVKPPQKEDGE